MGRLWLGLRHPLLRQRNHPFFAGLDGDPLSRRFEAVPHRHDGVLSGLTRKQLVEGAAQTVNIGANVHGAAIGYLLRRHVVDGAQRDPLPRHLFGVHLIEIEPRQAEVQNLDHALGRDHQVRSLDVPVHQPSFADLFKSHRRLADNLAGVRDGKRMAVPAEKVEVDAVDVFHDQEARSRNLASIHGADDIGMINRADGFHLAIETGHRTLVPDPVPCEDLQRHHAAQLGVQGLVDRAHPSFAQFLEQLVFAEQRQLVRRLATWFLRLLRRRFRIGAGRSLRRLGSWLVPARRGLGLARLKSNSLGKALG